MSRALGRYELLRPLARGGMAEVYLARRRSAGIEKWLVVKRMRPETTGDPRFLDLFVREARLSMSLVHQNIVPVFDFGKIDDQVFLAMERVEGRDLGSSLARATTHRMPPLVAAFIAAECCQALDYAHQRKGPDGVALGIVHRDVTPRNVLLSWSGEVKLTDFGIAALAGDANERLLGTPQYMAPEQARSEAIDPRADIYSIGLVMREAVSGIRSRPGGDRDAILGAARRGELLPWSHLGAPAQPAPPAAGFDDPRETGELAEGSGDHTQTVRRPPEAPPEALVAIIDRATAMSPADRYPDARAMLEDLDRFMVTHRAAQRGELPARQLATWLATVWNGAHDELEPDSTIEANHLVSFLDDGALDLVGTGTIRSLAATVADLEPAALVTKPTAAPIMPVVPAAGTPALPRAPTEPPLRASQPPRRPSQISSANATVASGSFHVGTGEVRTEIVSRATSAPATLAARRALPKGIVAFAAIAGAIVIVVAAFVATSRARDRAAATTAQLEAAEPDPAGATGAAPATGAASATGTGAASDPGAGSPRQAEGRASIDGAGDTAGTGAPAAADNAAPHTVDVPRPQPDSDPASPGRPGNTPRSSPSRPGNRPPAAMPDVPPIDDAASVPQKTAKCRVRINLTPWAFYTVDGDATRYETPSTIELTPGSHRLRVWNPELRIERDIVINVPADRATMNYSEPLQPPTLPSR